MYLLSPEELVFVVLTCGRKGRWPRNQDTRFVSQDKPIHLSFVQVHKCNHSWTRNEGSLNQTGPVENEQLQKGQGQPEWDTQMGIDLVNGLLYKESWS